MEDWASVPEGRTANLGNWRTAPHNKWSFQNVSKVLTTDIIDRRAGSDTQFNIALADLGDLSFRAPDGEMTVDECLAQSDTDGLLVLKDGAVVYERYENGMTADTRHIMFSVSKSILGATFGILAREGLVDTGRLATDYVPEFAGSAYEGATVQQLLDMTVAIEFVEDYTLTDGDVIRYRRATNWDPAKSGEGELSTRGALTQFKRSGGDHGERFHYVSPNTDALGWVAERATGMNYAAILTKYLWQPMGAEYSAYITVDNHGGARAAGGICATLRDIGRFGALMTREPLVADVIPQAFIDDTFLNGDPDTWARGESANFLPGGRYRNKWYIKAGDKKVALAIGIHGQWIHVDHERNIVIVKQSSQPLAGQDATDHMLMACFDAIADAIG
jgi:hypothetical protein